MTAGGVPTGETTWRKQLLTTCIASAASRPKSARLSNLVGGLVVGAGLLALGSAHAQPPSAFFNELPESDCSGPCIEDRELASDGSWAALGADSDRPWMEDSLIFALAEACADEEGDVDLSCAYELAAGLAEGEGRPRAHHEVDTLTLPGGGVDPDSGFEAEPFAPGQEGSPCAILGNTHVVTWDLYTETEVCIYDTTFTCMLQEDGSWEWEATATKLSGWGCSEIGSSEDGESELYP